ncbi:MAG: ATP-binding cassette domain-containing protein [Clostridia bacterium]|jgi:NitT/TauT family transport system ATP-binding protein|nr:ATP-binding cassette domain-containing protein [Clostridia bacterium]
MHTPILSLSEVSFSYFTETEQTPAVSHLNLSILPGEFAAIVGPSGCGKTSVLSLIMGLLRPQAGTITFADPNLRIGYMLQRDHLLEWRTVEKNVLLGLEVQHRKTERTRANALRLLDAYGLGAFKAYYPQQLSGGMRQKVALIRTLALEPDLLLLDEPFSALDYQTRLQLSDEVYRIIREQKKTAILVTHDISEAVSMADRVLVFSKRPSHVKTVIETGFSAALSPLERRHVPEFLPLYDRVWKEIDR